MKSQILAFLGLVSLLPAQEVATNASPSPTPEISWTNVPDEIWDNAAQPYAEAALKAWYQESDPAKKAAIAERVSDLANRADDHEIAMELVVGKPVEEVALKVPTNVTVLPLEFLKEWDFQPEERERNPAVIRRIAPRNFELWTQSHGWLFDEKGNVVNEAKVPHPEGGGREWYGAFLPDGQWMTTDRWGIPNEAFLFSKTGKFINAVPVGWICWARADQDGRHWVAGMQSGWGYDYGTDDELRSGDLRISPWGWKQRVAHYLKHWHLPLPNPSWAFVQKIPSATDFVDLRDLGSRGGFGIRAQTEDRKSSLVYGEAGHGRGVGWPSYKAEGPNLAWCHVIPYVLWNRYNFGFFPNSQVSWVGGGKYPLREGSFQSWIIDPKGKVLGWLPAERVGDDPDGKRMWFVDEQGRLLKVAPDGVVSEVLQPTLAGAPGPDAPFAHVLFPDLKLGFFYTKPGHLVLARWP